MYRSFRKHWHLVSLIIMGVVICLWWFIESVFHVAPYFWGEGMSQLAKVAFYSVLTIDIAYILLIVYAGVSFDLFFLGWFGVLITIMMIALGLDIASRAGVGSRSWDAPTVSIGTALLALAVTVVNHVIALAVTLMIRIFGKIWHFVT